VTGEDLNHYVPRVPLDEALILGGTVRAVCGVTIEPELQVGSSGQASCADLDVCSACEVILDLEELFRQTSKPVAVTK